MLKAPHSSYTGTRLFILHLLSVLSHFSEDVLHLLLGTKMIKMSVFIHSTLGWRWKGTLVITERGEMWWWRWSLKNPAPLRHLHSAGRSLWAGRGVRVRDLLAGLSGSLAIIRRRKACRAVVSHYAICTIKICPLENVLACALMCVTV